MPGITRDVSITLTDLITAFNTSWTLEDRLTLVKGLDLEARSENITINTLGDIFSKMDLDKITVSDLLLLGSGINDFKKRIENKKSEIIKSREQD